MARSTANRHLLLPCEGSHHLWERLSFSARDVHVARVHSAVLNAEHAAQSPRTTMSCIGHGDGGICSRQLRAAREKKQTVTIGKEALSDCKRGLSGVQ